MNSSVANLKPVANEINLDWERICYLLMLSRSIDDIVMHLL